jgi:radical SAM superfamily enzyme YgiQ (UPF0313 family)
VRLLLINPSNPLVSIVKFGHNRWNKYRIWQPLSLMALAGLTPPEWDVAIHDENMDAPLDVDGPLPDLVGITAFTSQAPRAYEIAAHYRRLGVPVVMGGIHATMRVDEAMAHADAVVTGEADGIWPQVLEDAARGQLQWRYDGGLAAMDTVRPARHDLLASEYAFGAIQTTRGCPMNCTFCCVTAFNGARYRQRSVADVVAEFRSIPEKRVLVVDDNLIGTTREHIARAKALFRALADAKTGKEWIAQATINFADDEELLTLADQAGCAGVFIGFESPTVEGLAEVGKRFNVHKGRSLAASVARIQRHHMVVVGSFIIGLDVDTPGIGQRTADAARAYGVDILNTLFLTPLPGTKLWDQTVAQGRLVLDQFPRDWQYYTLTYPVARYAQLTQQQATDEMLACGRAFYSVSGILGRVWRNVWERRRPLITACANLSNRKNQAVGRAAYAKLNRECEAREGDARECVAREPGSTWDAGLDPGLGASRQTG